jgi:hypothetical protein
MSGTTYLPTDLQRRYRLILDEAKSGEARVRDLDGTSVMLLPEAEVQTLRQVNAAAANLAAVERVLEDLALESDDYRPDLLQFGDWTWLRVFDRDDLHEFARDVREAIIIAVRERSTTVLDEQLHAWRVTAQQAEDPVLRAVLQAGPSEDDFVEVHRPGSPLSQTPHGSSPSASPTARPGRASRSSGAARAGD